MQLGIIHSIFIMMKMIFKFVKIHFDSHSTINLNLRDPIKRFNMVFTYKSTGCPYGVASRDFVRWWYDIIFSEKIIEDAELMIFESRMKSTIQNILKQ